MTEQTDVMRADTDAAARWKAIWGSFADRLPAEDLAYALATHRLAHPPADQRLREALETLVACFVDVADLWDPNEHAAIIAARTALAAPLDDAWVLVPREITPEMESAWRNTAGLDCRPAYRAMIAAAPTSPILSIGEGM